VDGGVSLPLAWAARRLLLKRCYAFTFCLAFTEDGQGCLGAGLSNQQTAALQRLRRWWRAARASFAQIGALCVVTAAAGAYRLITLRVLAYGASLALIAFSHSPSSATPRISAAMPLFVREGASRKNAAYNARGGQAAK